MKLLQPTSLLFYLLGLIDQTGASYNVYNYDMTTPMFTPDGLLKQVEYASEASNHCFPMIIIPLTLASDESEDEEGTNAKTILVMATLTAALDPDSSEPTSMAKSQGRRGQNRIIEMPIVPPSALSSRSGTSLIMGINGILPDSVALLQHARKEVENSQRYYGIHDPHRPTFSGSTAGNGETLSSHHTITSTSPFASAPAAAVRMAHSIANQCQERSFGGGIRPYGASVVVCGVDREEISVCITNPSGAVSYYSFEPKARQAEELVAGGNVIGIGLKAPQTETIRNQLHGRIRNLDWEACCNHEDRYRVLSKAALQNACEALIAIHRESAGSRQSNDISVEQQNYLVDHMDLVLITSQGGAQRLNKAQIRKMMESLT